MIAQTSSNQAFLIIQKSSTAMCIKATLSWNKHFLQKAIWPEPSEIQFLFSKEDQGDYVEIWKESRRGFQKFIASWLEDKRAGEKDQVDRLLSKARDKLWEVRTFSSPSLLISFIDRKNSQMRGWSIFVPGSGTSNV